VGTKALLVREGRAYIYLFRRERSTTWGGGECVWGGGGQVLDEVFIKDNQRKSKSDLHFLRQKNVSRTPQEPTQDTGSKRMEEKTWRDKTITERSCFLISKGKGSGPGERNTSGKGERSPRARMKNRVAGKSSEGDKGVPYSVRVAKKGHCHKKVRQIGEAPTKSGTTKFSLREEERNRSEKGKGRRGNTSQKREGRENSLGSSL